MIDVRPHSLFHRARMIPAHVKVLVGDNSEQFAVEITRIGHGEGGIARFLDDLYGIGDRVPRGQCRQRGLETGLEALLNENELQWIEETGIERNSFSVNREILNQVFALPRSTSEPRRSSLTLNNGTFVLIELLQVNEGSIDSIPGEERQGFIESVTADLGNSEFQAYMNTLRANSDIESNLLQSEVF